MLCDFGKVGCPGGVRSGEPGPGAHLGRAARRRMRGRLGAGSPFSPLPPGRDGGFAGLVVGGGISTIISLENLLGASRELLCCPRARWQPNGAASIGSPRRALPAPLAPTAGLGRPPPRPQFVCIVSEKERISELQLKTPSVSNESPIVFHNVFGRSLPANSFKP